MSAPRSHLIHCPFCKSALEVETATGKITNKWQASKIAQSSKEKFSDALKKIEESKEKSEEFFSSAAEKLQNKKKKADQLFGDSLKKIKEEGLVERPPNPFDLD